MSKPKYDADQVRKAAEGKWDIVIIALAPRLEEAIRANGRGVSCPWHGGKSKSAFRVFGPRDKDPFTRSGGCVCNTCGVKGNGYLTLQCELNLPGDSGFVEVVNLVGEFLGLSPEQQQARRRPQQQPLPVQIGPSAAQLKAVEEGKIKLSKEWERDLDLNHEQAAVTRAYLGFRGMNQPASLTDVKFSPAEPYYKDDIADKRLVVLDPALYLKVRHEEQADKVNKKFVGRFPCWKFKIRNNNRETYKIGRIYMMPDGSKFVLGDRKKPSYQSAALSNEGLRVELFPFTGGFLGISEGFENSVAVRWGIGIPCWPTWSSSYMPKFDPPKRCKHLFIFADRDVAGLKGALKLKLRLAIERPDVTVTIFLPPDGLDWNDVYKTFGTAGFRNLEIWKTDSIEAALRKEMNGKSKAKLPDIIKTLTDRVFDHFKEALELRQTA